MFKAYMTYAAIIGAIAYDSLQTALASIGV